LTVKRNDPCPCGSGKKYKTCCHEKDNLAKREQTKQALRVNQPLQENVILEKLGIRPRNANRFYVNDLVQFYNETLKEEEKKEQALSQSLSLFVDYLEHQRIATWDACDEYFWRKLLTFSQLDLAYEQSEAKTKAFFETILAFSKWLDSKCSDQQTELLVAPLVDQLEEHVLQAVRFLEVYHENVENPFLTGYSELRRETLFQEAGDTPTVEGVYEIQGQNREEITCESLLTRMTYTVHLPQEISGSAPNGTTFIGVIKEVAPNRWEILALDRVFPSEANSFLRQAIGVQA
jgi:hypothetical protein